ncbi:MAG: hypothetical protein LC624_00880 [Halobacteriales archaeon]|nr:hypothetical protein [Halobacteriales archaeon]
MLAKPLLAVALLLALSPPALASQAYCQTDTGVARANCSSASILGVAPGRCVTDASGQVCEARVLATFGVSAWATSPWLFKWHITVTDGGGATVCFARDIVSQELGTADGSLGGAPFEQVDACDVSVRFVDAACQTFRAEAVVVVASQALLAPGSASVEAAGVRVGLISVPVIADQPFTLCPSGAQQS